MDNRIDTIMNELILGKDIHTIKMLADLPEPERTQTRRNIQKNVLDKILHYLNRNDLSFEDMAKVLASKAHRHMNREDQTLAFAIDYGIVHKNEIYKELLKQRPFLP